MNNNFADLEDSNLLSREEINQRLHRYNLNGNMSVFSDVPPLQYVEIMYPSVITPFNSDLTPEERQAERERFLTKLFGPLD